MPTITLRLELHKPTQAKQDMYQRWSHKKVEHYSDLLNNVSPQILQVAKSCQNGRGGDKSPFGGGRFYRMTEINTAFVNWLLVHRRKGVIHMAKCDKCKKNTANIESERKGKLCNDCAKKNK